MAVGLERGRLDLLADLQRGQPPLVVAVLRLVVAALLVRGEESAERDHGARRAELGVASVRSGRAEPQRDGLPAGVLHLRGDRPLPDELVERVLVARELALARRAGMRNVSPAGRIASCASCAFFTLRS